MFNLFLLLFISKFSSHQNLHQILKLSPVDKDFKIIKYFTIKANIDFWEILNTHWPVIDLNPLIQGQLNLINFIELKCMQEYLQISFVRFWKNRKFSISSNYFDEKEPSKIKISTRKEKIKKLLVSFSVTRDSISVILKENKFHICVLPTFTRSVFRAQPNIYDGLVLRE